VKASPARCIACSAEAGGRFRAGGVTIRRCTGCGLAWRAAFPEAAELAALYGDDYLERWGIDGPDRLAQGHGDGIFDYFAGVSGDLFR
jgi:hypothetical protein